MAHTATMLRRLVCAGCVAGLTSAATLHAQARDAAPTHDRAAMMANCQTMMKGMKADQDKLDELVAKMNAATGQLKIEQMAAVLTELVARQKVMHAHMMHMNGAPAAEQPQNEPPQAGDEQHH